MMITFPNMLKKIFILILILFSLIFPISSQALEKSQSYASADLKVSYENINPSDDYRFAFKRYKEKITLWFFSFFPERKTNYYQELMDVRLAELKYVVDKKDISNIQTASQRYFTTVGEATEFLVNNKNLSSKKDSYKMQLEKHILVVDRLKDTYNDTTAEWRFIKHNLDYLKIYLSKLFN